MRQDVFEFLAVDVGVLPQTRFKSCGDFVDAGLHSQEVGLVVDVADVEVAVVACHAAEGQTGAEAVGICLVEFLIVGKRAAALVEAHALPKIPCVAARNCGVGAGVHYAVGHVGEGMAVAELAECGHGLGGHIGRNIFDEFRGDGARDVDGPVVVPQGYVIGVGTGHRFLEKRADAVFVLRDAP